MKKQSELLTAFYRAYLEWVESGAPDEQPFRRDRGLCSNFDKFILSNCQSDDKYVLFKELNKELKDQFTEAGLCQSFPFNDGSFEYFYNECQSGYPWKNPVRIDWVKSHANTK